MISPQDVIALLEELATKTGESLDRYGFKVMSIRLEDATGELIPPRYLYESLWQKAQKSVAEGKTRLITNRLDRLDIIAKYLDAKHYSDFVLKQAEKRRVADAEKQADTFPAPLKACLGNWYSYVRCNSGADVVLQSPVSVYVEQGKVWMSLHGPNRIFTGQLHYKAACIHSLLASEDKSIHLVFKIGLAKSPQVLQGVFSGVSSSEAPIAGREILVRSTETNISQMENLRLALADPESEVLHPCVKEYFRHYSGNYIKITHVGTFNLDDLCQASTNP